MVSASTGIANYVARVISTEDMSQGMVSHTGKENITIKVSMNRHATVLTTNPMGPFIQKYPGTTFFRLERRCGRIAARYDAIDTRMFSKDLEYRMLHPFGTYGQRRSW
jgi:hypothetical protein